MTLYNEGFKKQKGRVSETKNKKNKKIQNAKPTQIVYHLYFLNGHRTKTITHLFGAKNVSKRSMLGVCMLILNVFFL